jgi:transcription-repair coupling factor (superfamily II helicase)
MLHLRIKPTPIPIPWYTLHVHTYDGNRFGYTPTDDQATCFLQIAADMVNNTRPMDRLVCGDVGFGKTEVAMRAIYRAVRSNKQVALLAPTRVLAKQHERTLKARMPDVK